MAGPTLVGVSALATAASGTTRTPDISVAVSGGPPITGDIVIAHSGSRVAGTNTLSAPAGEGWTVIDTLFESGISNAWWWKRWGSGSTDDTTPTFTNSTGGLWGVTLSVWRGCRASGNPYSQISAVRSNVANATITTSTVATNPGSESTTVWSVYGADDNTINGNTRGTVAYDGASYNISTVASMAMAYESGVDSSTLSCSFTQSTSGPDISRALTIALSAEISGSGAAVMGPLETVGSGSLILSGSGAAVDSIAASGAGGVLLTGAGSPTATQPTANGTGEQSAIDYDTYTFVDVSLELATAPSCLLDFISTPEATISIAS